MEEQTNVLQQLINLLNTPIAQRKGVTIPPDDCKIWVEELSNFLYDFRWHSVNETPKEEGEYIIMKDWGLARNDIFYAKFENGKWSMPQVLLWTKNPREKK